MRTVTGWFLCAALLVPGFVRAEDAADDQPIDRATGIGVEPDALVVGPGDIKGRIIEEVGAEKKPAANVTGRLVSKHMGQSVKQTWTDADGKFNPGRHKIGYYLLTLGRGRVQG